MRIWQYHTSRRSVLESEIGGVTIFSTLPDKTHKLLPIVTKLSALLFLGVLIQGDLLAEDRDSLAYIFRQDNLSTNNDFQLNYKQHFKNSDIQVIDVLKYKVFSYDSDLSNEKQFSVEHRLRSDYTWGESRTRSIRLESGQHQDHRTGLASSIDNWALLAGLKHNENLSLFIGGRSVERYGIVDKGWTTELDIGKSWQSAGQRSLININGSRDQLTEHLNHTLNARGEYQIRFGGISTYRTSIYREARLQAFFTDSLGSSQSRNNENLNWQNMFTYHLGKNLHLSHRLEWGDQLTKISRIRVDETSTLNLSSEDRKRFSLLNEISLEMNNPNFSTLTAFKIENSQNKYYVDYTQVLYQAKESLLWQKLGPLDTLQWTSSLSRLEYDTPDTTNDDDRDEWRLNTEIRTIWEPSPFYRLELGTKLGLYHLIYLFNTRSSENHWNRNLVLWSGVSWRRHKWSGDGRARIRSNYFDYDYDDLFIELDQPSRSFVHRSLELTKKIKYNFGKRWSISSKAAFRWEDEGKLKWDAFIQEVSSSREQSEMNVELSYSYRGWEGWIGYLTHQRAIEYAAASRDTDHWQGQGPLMGVNYRLGKRLDLRGDARFISVLDGEREYLLPKVFFTLVYR
ncbi:MAG: hypothetical protein HQ506_06745 [Candidatus Marinimicrobia bacterium]|nr:hypothetical protein [Candidatus Neomarinimicrobiota bacterium]